MGAEVPGLNGGVPSPCGLDMAISLSPHCFLIFARQSWNFRHDIIKIHLYKTPFCQKEAIYCTKALWPLI